MIDTGSTISFTNTKITDPRGYIKVDKRIINTMNGGTVLDTIITRDAFEEFNSKEKFSFFVHNFSDTFDILLGSDILEKLKTNINYETQEITFNGRLHKLIIPGRELSEPSQLEIEEICNLVEEKVDRFRLDHLNKEEKDSLGKILGKYNDLMFNEETDNLSFTHHIKHHIRTKTNEPIYTRVYRTTGKHKEVIDKTIEEYLESGIIRHSESPYNAPVWAVPKKMDASGKEKWRVVIDYRKINNETIEDKYPIPNIEDILDKLGRCQYFTTLDLAKGFHQIEIEEKDIEKTAFSTSSGHYEFLRMPFGLKNAPATFQRLMNNVLKEYIGKLCFVYLDDIIIFSTSLEEHLVALNKIFETLRKANLKLSLDKCEFMKRETEYLGHIITTDGIKPNPKKIEAIQKYPLPKTEREIKSFLGLVGYYRKFIQDFAKIAKPMTKYLKKGNKINITDIEFISAYNKFKTLLVNDPILKYPDFSKEFTLTTDASNYAIGAVLAQQGHPICFASRTLNQHETNYSVIEKEFLAIVWATKYFRPYLYGRRFTIKSDHRPLQWINSLDESNSKFVRWKVRLSEFDYKVEYLEGKENHVADALSRIKETNMHVEQQEQQDENESLATQHSAEEDNRNYIEISEKPINIYGTQWIIKRGRIGTHIFEKLFNTKKRHTWVVKDKLTEEKSKEILRKIHSESIIGVKIDNIDDWNMFQNTYLTFINQDLKVKLLKCNTLLEDVRSRAEMQEKILKEHLKNNHRGISCVYQTMKRKFYIPNLEHLITETINQCETCKLAKYERNPVKLPFKETETCNGPREIFSMDIWMPTTGVNYVSCIDRFSKYATLIKIKDRSWLSAKEAMFQVINIMGKPKKLIVDQDACLTAECFKNFLTKEKVKVHIVSSKTGLADIERFHGTMNEHIRILRIKEDKENIDEVVEALKHYNHTLHSTTGQRPIDLHLQDEKETKNKVNKSKWVEYRNNKENRKDVEIDERYVKDKNKKLGRKYRRVGNTSRENDRRILVQNKKEKRIYNKGKFRKKTKV